MWIRATCLEVWLFLLTLKNKLSYRQGNVSHKFILRGRLKEEIKTQAVSWHMAFSIFGHFFLCVYEDKQLHFFSLCMYFCSGCFDSTPINQKCYITLKIMGPVIFQKKKKVLWINSNFLSVWDVYLFNFGIFDQF